MTRRQLRRLIGLVAPVAAAVVVLVVLHGVGIPLSLPGVVVVFLLLFVARIVLGMTRRRRAQRR